MIINPGNWCQATVSTGAVGIRTAASILRRLGYEVRTSNMGNQVTHLGTLKMTLIDVRPGNNADTFYASKVLRCHVLELREREAA